jgi:hypothetical protein
MNDEVVRVQVGDVGVRSRSMVMIARGIRAARCRLNGLPVVVGVVKEPCDICIAG